MLIHRLSWGAVLSPVFFLAWIAYTARAGPVGFGTWSPDPPGYRERLEAYKPFVRCSRALAHATHPHERRRLLGEVMALASPTLPVPEAVELGLSASEDARRPIILARDLAIREVVRELESALSRKDYEESAEYALGYLRLAWVLRYGDPTTLMISNLHINSAKRYLEQVLPYLSPQTLQRITQALIEMEENRKPLLYLIKRDLTLVEDSLVSLKTTPHYWEALMLASTAMRRLSQGNSLEPVIELVSRSLEGRARHSLWSALCGWQAVIDAEVQNQRSLRSLLAQARFLEIKKRGQKAEDFYELGLPRSARIDPLTGEPAPLVITASGARFLFVPQGAPKLALGDSSTNPEDPSL